MRQQIEGLEHQADLAVADGGQNAPGHVVHANSIQVAFTLCGAVKAANYMH